MCLILAPYPVFVESCQTMRYVAAYLLASLGEEGAPSKEKIVSILDSVGIDVDDEKLDKVFPS